MRKTDRQHQYTRHSCCFASARNA